MTADGWNLVCLIGPTASGKTALSLEIAQHIPLRIISVDSAMVYRGMDIGTGKPSAEWLHRFPHEFVNLIDPSQPWSAGDFLQQLGPAIARAKHANQIPILVGGTMLYFYLLLQGIAPAPALSDALKEQLRMRAQAEGTHSLHRQLSELDPESAQRIGVNDYVRIERALGVALQTGRTLSHFQRQQKPFLPPASNVLLLCIQKEREQLYLRIQRRFDQMVSDGLVDEVLQLKQRSDMEPELPAMRAIGYRQVWKWLDGEGSFKSMEAQVLTASRILLKRQMNWLNRFQGLRNILTVEDALTQISAFHQTVAQVPTSGQ